MKTNYKFFILILGVVLCVLFFFVPLGEETGFASLWYGAHPILAILIGLVPIGFMIGWLIQIIKKW